MNINPFFEEDKDSEDSQWQRVSSYKPQLFEYIEISFHKFRGKPWYVLTDPARKQSIRINQRSFEFLRRMDGGKNVDDIWQELCEECEEESYEKEEVVEILSSLLQLKLIEPGVNLSSRDFIAQKEKETTLKKQQSKLNPLAIKIPIFNPDGLFELLSEKIAFVFKPYCLLIGLGFILVTLSYALANLSLIFTDMVSAEHYLKNNAVTLIASYIILKVIHEAAHGVSLKRYGLSSKEFGVTLMVFMPIPYVDASNIWALNDKWKRIVISMAGIYVELIASAIALLIYLSVSDELTKSLCLSVALIGLSSSILFNINPLLKFDGYYALEDLLEIPDLYDRSRKYCASMYKNWFFSMPHNHVVSQSEGAILLVFGHASIVFRFVLSFYIALYLIESFLFVGAILSFYIVYQQLLKPINQFFNFIRVEVLNSSFQGAALIRVLPVILGLTAVIFFLPVKSSTSIEGVSWLGLGSKIVAPQSALVERVHQKFGENIEEGDLLFSLDPEVDQSKLSLLRSELGLLEANYFSAFKERKIRSDFDSEISAKKDAIKAQQQQLSLFDVKSLEGGVLVPADSYELENRWVKKGQVLAYVLNDSKTIVRAAINQNHFEYLENRIVDVEVRFSSQPLKSHAATLLQILPSATKYLPHPALAVHNGGKIPAQPDGDGKEFYVDKELMILEFEMDKSLTPYVGERAYVRISFGNTSIFESVRRKITQTFSEALLTI